MDEKPDISELVQLMFVGLIGANNEIEKVLKDFHEKHNKPSHGILFYEFLVHQPLHREPPTDPLDKTWMFSPFPYRLARKSLLMIPPDKASKLIDEKLKNKEAIKSFELKRLFEFSTDVDIAQADILIKMENSIYTQYMYKYWENENEKKCDNLTFENLEEPFIDPQAFDKPFFAKTKDYMKDCTETEMVKRLKDENKNMHKYSKRSLLIFHGLRFPQIACFINKNKQITSFLIPIASSEIFYGDLLVCIPHFELRKRKGTKEKYESKDIVKLKQLASKLLKCIKKHYVPALALIHEHFLENLVSKNQDIKKEDLTKSHVLKLGETTVNYKSHICRKAGEKKDDKSCYEHNCDYLDKEPSNNVVEKYLHKLWQDRRTGKTDIKKSLVFKDRLYTDPRMLDVLEGFLKPSKAKLKKDRDFLPSVLVVGAPGSGKEIIPALLKLFSDCYNRGETYKLNMASLKPDAVAPVAMVGGEITWEGGRTSKLEGIFEKIREETRIEFGKFFFGENDYKGDKSLTEKAKEHEGNLISCINKSFEDLKEFDIKPGEEPPKLELKRDPDNQQIETPVENLKSLKEKLDETQIDKSKKGQIQINDVIKLVEKLKYVNSLNVRLIELEKKISMLSKEQTCEQENEQSIEALFQRTLITDFVENLKPEEKLIVKELFGRFPTVVLDELNSLSIESQGVLLRFIENAEITPIGGYKDKIDEIYGKDYREFLTDFLVVGLMNEDPEEITREKAIRFLEKESYIGGLLGDLLYEHILKIRRLRPDLRSRMMRNGKFEMPKLAEHRTDIPVIFYLFIDNAKGDYFVNSEIRITRNALEYLMRPEFEWFENVRLLQTLSKKVVEIIYEDYENKRYTGEDMPKINKISGKEQIIIKEKQIKKSMEEIDMGKEFKEAR